jgi:hypothetical protein
MVSFLKTNLLPDKDFQRAYYEFANNSQHIEQLLKSYDPGAEMTKEFYQIMQILEERKGINLSKLLRECWFECRKRSLYRSSDGRQ